MENQIEVVYQAIVDGTLSLGDAVTYTQALANDAWGVIAKLAHLVLKIQQVTGA